eukprot:7196-Hanusia_phi.AAC.4
MKRAKVRVEPTRQHLAACARRRGRGQSLQTRSKKTSSAPSAPPRHRSGKEREEKDLREAETREMLAKEDGLPTRVRCCGGGRRWDGRDSRRA